VRSGGRISEDFGAEPPTLFGRVLRKRYRYLLLADDVRDPFWEGRALRVVDPIDWALVAREAACAVGTHDFAAFRSSGDQRESTVRTIEAIEIRAQRDDPRITAIDVTGNAFLYNMVRILVGTLLDMGRGRLAEGAVAAGLASKRRESLGFTAPAHGLYLEEVTHTVPLVDCWPM
jgi:tRNA pseudouridine38-40 synthase